MHSLDFQGLGNSQGFLDPKRASEFLTKRGLPTAIRTLAKLRCIGGGPIFRRFGRRIVYERHALDTWAECRLSRELKNTSDCAVNNDLSREVLRDGGRHE
jgi:hypothetical protein